LRYEGRFFINGEIIDTCVEVEDGKITRIKKSMSGCTRIPGTVLPGGTDLHVHFREPGQEHKEDFYTGTMSAAFGGITMVADMPNNRPPITTEERFREKLNEVQSRANVDFSLYIMLTRSTPTVPGALYKWYMYEAPDAKLVDGHITVHAELPECAGNADTLSGYDSARPARCEVRAVRKLLNMNRKFHIAHISSPDTVDMCKIGRFTCEITPHHLFLHKNMELKGFGKVNPPLRARWVASRLWEELVEGRIDIIASDHAPHTIDEKEQEFREAPPGIPEVETYLPIFMYLMRQGKISLTRLVKIIMERPPEIIGVKKGKIAPGYDADFVAFKLSDVKRIKPEKLHYKCQWTPYEGFFGIFPTHVYLRGEKIIENGEMVGEKIGEFKTSRS